MGNKEWLFTELKNRIWINVAKDEQCIVAEKCGSIHGLSSSGLKLFLKYVLFVPDLGDNRISVSKLVKVGLDIQFSKTKTIIKKDGY